MSIIIKLKKSDKYFLIPIVFSLVSIFLITTTFLVFHEILPNKLPLFYSLPWGEGQLVNKQQFFILPAILFLITLINTFFSWQLHSSQNLLKKVLLLTLIPITLIILITAIKIMTIFI